MAVFCLTKQASDRLKRAFKEGEIDPEKISSISSAERRAMLEKYVGKENSHQVNALFESKLLLKNQKAGYISWAKKVTGITQEVRRDLISKIERLDKVLDPKEEDKFLQDLAETKLGFKVTQEEAKNIAELSKGVTRAKEKMKEDFTFPTDGDRLAYGIAQVNLENYFNESKLAAGRLSIFSNPLKKTLDVIKQSPGTLKSIVASLDNSFWGRQGVKVLLDIRTSPIWIKNFLKSWKDIGNELKGKDAMELIKADIYSRPNALNGKYRVGKYGLDVLSEEAFPSSLPEKIPVFKRLFKASESAYNGAALRLRADLADRLIKIAEKQGVNTLDPKQAEGMGHLIGSLTGRGSLQMTEGQAKAANVAFFSIKFLKANIDTLTAHQFDSKATAFTQKEARLNLVSMVATLTSVYTIASALDPNSVESDPRSTNFGKVKVFGHWMDITGGMASLVTLSARLAPTYHNNKLSWWSKNSSGAYTETGLGGYGKTTPLDVAESFLEGKLSPAAGVLRDVWKRQTFSGEPVTLKTELNSQLPLSYQLFEQLKKDPNSSSILGSMIFDALGFSTSSNTYQKDWSATTSKTLLLFKNKVGDAKFSEANNKFNQLYNAWSNKTVTDSSYKNLSDGAKQQVMTKGKEAIQNQVLKSYNFVYKKPVLPSSQRKEAETIKRLTPK